jgi:hypothetical protein
MRLFRLGFYIYGHLVFTRYWILAAGEMWFCFPAGDGMTLRGARDRSGIFALKGQKLERIARFFAERRAAKNAPKY